MGNTCSGFRRDKEAESSAPPVALKSYNEIRIIAPTPSPEIIAYNGDANGTATLQEEAPITKAPPKLAPLAEPEILSPMPPPKKALTSDDILDSPESESEKSVPSQSGDGGDAFLKNGFAESHIDVASFEGPVAAPTAPSPPLPPQDAPQSSYPPAQLTAEFPPIDSASSPPASPQTAQPSAASPPKQSPPTSLPPPLPEQSPPTSPPPPPEPAQSPPTTLPSPPPPQASLPPNIHTAPSANILVVDVGAPDAETAAAMETWSAEPPSAPSTEITSSHKLATANDNPITLSETAPHRDRAEASSSPLKKTNVFHASAVIADSGAVELIVSNGSANIDHNLNNMCHNPPDDRLRDQKQPKVKIAANGVNGTTTPSTLIKKDGHYFLEKTLNEENRIQSLCAEMDAHLAGDDLNEEAAGKVRAFIGKASLLTSKKFKQFKGLCRKNLDQDDGEAFVTTDEDLQGFWDLIMIQVDELDATYQDLLTLKSNDWVTPIKSKQSESGKSPPATPRRKGPPAKKITATPISAAAEARNKAREEARKRLIAAKREAAKNQKKSSAGDSEGALSPAVNGEESEASQEGAGLSRKKSLSFTIP